MDLTNTLPNRLSYHRIQVPLVLITLVICAFFLAKGTTRLLASSLFQVGGIQPKISATQQIKSPKKQRNPLSGSKSPDPKEILKRNIFDSSTGPLWPPPLDPNELGAQEANAQKEVGPIPSAAEPPPECEQDLFLAAAIYIPHKPEQSLVALEGPKDVDQQHLYQTGMKVGDNELVRILPDMAYLLKTSGDYCSLKLFTDRRPKEKKKAKKRKKRRKKSKKAKKRKKRRRHSTGLSPRELKRGIKKVGKNRFQLERELVDKILRKNLRAVRKAKAVPHRRRGRVVGTKLYRIRRNSLLSKLGLKNGDLIRSINGYRMTELDSALEAYNHLQNANHITITLERHRHRKTLVPRHSNVAQFAAVFVADDCVASSSNMLCMSFVVAPCPRRRILAGTRSTSLCRGTGL